MIWRPILGVLIVVLVALGTAELMRRASLFYPDRYPAGDWDQNGLSRELEPIWFESADGTKLHGWLVRADRADAPLLVYFHGNAGNVTNRSEPAVRLADHGMHVFVFDYRGYGRSEGTPSEGDLYDDSLAAWDLMRERHDGPMVAYGESLGGPYAAFVSAKRHPCAVVMDSTFPSMGAVAREVYRPVPVHWLLRPGLETAKHLNRAGEPVLVMHSVADEVIPFSLGRELYEAIDVEKRFYRSESAPHSAMSWLDGEPYFEAIREFVFDHCISEAAR